MEKTIERQMTEILRETLEKVRAISPIHVTEIRVTVECDNCGRIWGRGVTTDYGLAPNFYECHSCAEKR